MSSTRGKKRRNAEQEHHKLYLERAQVFNAVAEWISKNIDDDFVAEKYASHIVGDTNDSDERDQFLLKHWRVLFSKDTVKPDASGKLLDCSAKVDDLADALQSLNDAYKRVDHFQRRLVRALKEKP